MLIASPVLSNVYEHGFLRNNNTHCKMTHYYKDTDILLVN